MVTKPLARDLNPIGFYIEHTKMVLVQSLVQTHYPLWTKVSLEKS